MLPLLVALFNLLVAGYALAAEPTPRTRMVFAAGPAGVGLWAVAWFVSVFNDQTLDAMRILGSIGGLLAIGGFAADGLLGLTRRRAAVLIGAAGVVVAAALFGLWSLVTHDIAGSIVPLAPRVVAVALIGVTVFAHRWRGDDLRIARHMSWAAGVCTAAYVAFAVVAYVSGRDGVDPLLLVILVSECFALVYIIDRKIEVRILLSRAVTYAILSMAVAFVAAVAFSVLGYPVDLVQVTLTVAIALFAAILFMGLGELMTSGVERLLFPERAKMARALGASRGEIAALKRRLERAEKLAIVGELAASVAHEIKNPLAPVRGYAQLLGKKLDVVDPKERELFERGLRIIQEESDRIDARIAELLGAAKAERRLANFDDRCDLERVILDAVAVAEGEEDAPVFVHVIEPSIGEVSGNADELRGALLNLLKNAVEAMADTDGERIEVRAASDAEEVVVEVIDEGVGLDHEQSARIFEAFFTTKAEGTGLGMAIARSAVEAAGGSIGIAPRTDHRGAVVTVRLRSAAKRPASSPSGSVVGQHS